MRGSPQRGRDAAALLLAGLLLAGCGGRETPVSHGNRHQILHLGNGAEPKDLDPQIVTGVGEDNIIRALVEGLVAEDPVDLHPVPGVAERWEISPDGTVYTFFLRANARWSNGDRVTARDFVESYERALSPQLPNEYAYMLFYLRNAEEFNKGKLRSFTGVGAAALDDRTLRLTLHHPTSYFLSLLNHHSWFPVHLPTIRKHGDPFSPGNRWTRPKNHVGNGPFQLSEWKVNQVIAVKKSPTYWDAASVRLREIRFYPMESLDTEERAFRSGQIHKTEKIPSGKIGYYRDKAPQFLRQAPYLGTYFFMLNTERGPLRDRRVRQALALSIDREALVRSVTRGGELPAVHFTPPGTAGYTSRARITPDTDRARQLLSQAGFPDGRNFPRVEILYNTQETHKLIAEALQQMWKKNLNVDIALRNEEWKVYLDSKTRRNYDIARFGWIADYVDPNAFLDMWLSGGGNNDTGWGSKEYDALIAEAGRTVETAPRFELFQKAEAILLEEMPIVPVYFYTSTYLIRPSVRHWNDTILDHQPYKHVWLDPETR